MYTYKNALPLVVRSVQRSLRHQIQDKLHPAHGAFLNDAYAGGFPSADHVHSAHDLTLACQAYLAPESPMEDDPDLLQRIRDAIAFQRRWQRPSGLIDLVARNIESPPDTGFVVEMLGSVVAAARSKGKSPGARLIAEELGEFVRAAATGMIDKGFHTPNHRWVVCAAIALAMKLFPSIPGRDYVERILAEGIDIQADGEYTERSNGVYNAVCNRCLIVMADCLEKPQLLDPVRQNLDFISHMLREDGTVETAYSTRQDKGQSIVPSGMMDAYLEMAHRDNNGLWASIADRLFEPQAASKRAGSHVLAPFLQTPRLRHECVDRQPLRDRFVKHFAASGLWRVKDGPLSAIAMTGQRSIFSLQFGRARLRGVKISGSYHSQTHLCPTQMLKSDRGVQLVHNGADSGLAAFFRPLNRPVPFGEFKKADAIRERWAQPDMQITVDVAHVNRGFDLHLKSHGGQDRVPMEIEFSFDGAGEWETADTVLQARPQQSVVLKDGFGTFRVGDDAITIGPGDFAHCDWNMRESNPTSDAFRVLITFTAPFDRTLQIRAGYWSLATRGLL